MKVKLYLDDKTYEVEFINTPQGQRAIYVINLKQLPRKNRRKGEPVRYARRTTWSHKWGVTAGITARRAIARAIDDVNKNLTNGSENAQDTPESTITKKPGQSAPRPRFLNTRSPS